MQEVLAKVEVGGGGKISETEPIENTFNVINIKPCLQEWPRDFVTLAPDNFSTFNSWCG